MAERACPPHAWIPQPDGPDRCERCGLTYPEAMKGFGVGGFTTKSRRKRPLKSLSG